MARWIVAGAAAAGAWCCTWLLIAALDGPIMYVAYELVPEPIQLWWHGP